MGRREEKLAKVAVGERALLTSSRWNIVAPTMSGLSIEKRDLLEGGPVVVCERAIILAQRMRVDYWISSKSLRSRRMVPRGLMAVWTPRSISRGYIDSGFPWEELSTGVYVDGRGIPRPGNALTLGLEECVRREARVVRILGVDETMPAELRATLRAIMTEGRKLGLDIHLHEADTLISVRQRPYRRAR